MTEALILYFGNCAAWAVGGLFMWATAEDRAENRKYARVVLLAPVWPITAAVFVGRLFRDAVSRDD